MPYKVLITAPYMQPVVDRFMSVFRDAGIDALVPTVNERMSEEELLPIIGDVDGVICGDDRFTRRVLSVAGRLKVISKWGTGIDSIDKAYAHELGIRVCNTPSAFTDPAADTVLAAILAFARRTPWMDRTMKNGEWGKIPGVSLSECTLGVIGVGDIGKAVVRRAVAFGMKTLGHDVKAMPEAFINETGIEMVSKDQLLLRSDFVSLNCDLNPTSLHIMSDAQFDLMKQKAIVINTARGPLIDEPALVRALRNRQIGGAALDVFEVEPLPRDSPLLRMDNVLLSPHNANSSPTAWERVHQNTIRNLIRGLKEVER